VGAVRAEPPCGFLGGRIEEQAAGLQVEDAGGERERPLDTLLGEHDSGAGPLEGGEEVLGRERVEL
jgi:hypothetical protein